jgi:hypothetical protein
LQNMPLDTGEPIAGYDVQDARSARVRHAQKRGGARAAVRPHSR